MKITITLILKTTTEAAAAKITNTNKQKQKSQKKRETPPKKTHTKNNQFHVLITINNKTIMDLKTIS